MHVRTDRADAVRSCGAEGYQQEDEQEGQEIMTGEAIIVIVLGAFLFGMIMGLALGKANK